MKISRLMMGGLAVFLVLGLAFGPSVPATVAQTGTVSPGTGVITGVVTGSGNAVIAKAMVSLVAGRFHKRAITDAAGTYKLEGIPDGTYTVRAVARDYKSEVKQNVAVNATTPPVAQNFALTAWASLPSGTITGTVKDAGGAAIAKARVFLGGGEFRKMAITDAAGAYTLQGVPVGTYVVNASAKDYKSETKKDVAVAATATVSQSFALTAWASLPSGKITGTVKDASGVAIAKAMVSVGTRDFRKKAVTDENGTYTLDGVPVGTYAVRAFAKNYKPGTVKDVVVTANPTATATFTLEAGSPRRGDAGPGARNWGKQGSHAGNGMTRPAR